MELHGDRGTPSSRSDQMSSLQRYRSQTMKDYGLMIEYKHLRQHVPAGIYVLPSLDHPRTWFGTIFVHTGLYRNGIFKFTIYLPETAYVVSASLSLRETSWLLLVDSRHKAQWTSRPTYFRPQSFITTTCK
ncbi:hypothetical protein PINS_up001512 [Pythium insidiosum]|nr:hypothetical protein PINS_up001512 [Pythium insidiosum]